MATSCSSVQLFVTMWMLVSATEDICPYETCRCIEDSISCAEMNLTKLPSFTATEDSWRPYLLFNKNFLTDITKGGLLPGIRGIDFRDNPITNIDDDAFIGSENTIYDLKFSRLNLNKLPQAFLHLENLQNLLITDSCIGDWDVSILIHLGQTLQSLILDNVDITLWPSWIRYLSHLTNFEFSNSPVLIPDDPLDQLELVLKSITMMNVTMTSTKYMFSDLVTLNYLILDNNIITEVTGLPNFGNLTSLSLNNNNISDKSNLNDALRPVANSLQNLFLNFNNLTTFPNLSHILALDSLYITNNHISNTRMGSLPPNVTVLSLANNKLRSISNFMCSGFKLGAVTLSFNYITQIEGNDIPFTIYEIDFTSNLISQLKDTSFPQNSSLGTLTLDNNPISIISLNAFVNLQQLYSLSIKGSELTRLPMSIGLLNSLRSLDLSGNTGLVCTCVEKDLRQLVVSTTLIINGDCGMASIDYFLRILAVGCP